MNTTIHISGEIHKQIKLYCVEKNLSIKEFAEQVLVSYIEGKLQLIPTELPSQHPISGPQVTTVEEEIELNRLLKC